MKVNRLSIAAVAALGSLTLAACGSGDEAASGTQTVTTSVTSSAGTSSEAPTTTTPTTAPTAAGGSTGAAPASPSPGTTATSPGNVSIAVPPITAGTTDVGKLVTANGESAEVCVYGDGFGLHTVAAGTNTSCGFATATMNALTAGLNPTYDNVRDVLPATVTAHSPATGQDYQMSCTVNGEKVITCRGGNNAAVFMY